MNKIKECYKNKNKEQICDCLGTLAIDVRDNDLSLNDEEWDTLLADCKNENNENILYNLWGIAIHSGKNNNMKIFSNDILNDDQYLKRDMAISYLGTNYPEMKSELIKKFINSKNEYILFSISQLCDETNLSMKMEILLKAYEYIDPYDHQLHEALEFYLDTYGTEENLNYLLQLIQNDPSLKEKYEVPIDILQIKFQKNQNGKK